jgi:hypothetical protein
LLVRSIYTKWLLANAEESCLGLGIALDADGAKELRQHCSSLLSNPDYQPGQADMELLFRMLKLVSQI